MLFSCFRYAQGLLNRVQNIDRRYEGTNTSTAANLASDLTEKLEDLFAIAKATEVKNEQIEDTSSDNRDALEELKAVLAILASQEKDVKDCISNASAVANNASHALWNESSANYQASVDMLAELRSARAGVEEKVGLLEQNLPVSKHILDEALAHARELEDRASRLSRKFEETKMAAEDPLKAASVYADIKKAIDEAEEAVMKAVEAAEDAADAVVGLPDGPLVEQAKEALNRSKELYDDSSVIQNRMQELGTALYEHERKNQETESNTREEEERVEQIHTALDQLHLDLMDKSRDASEKANDVNRRMEAVKERIEEKEREIEERMKPKLQELLDVQEEGLYEAHRSVTAAERRFAQISNLTSILESKHTAIDRIGKDLTYNILALKEKIQVARAQANNVSPSVTSSCVLIAYFISLSCVCRSKCHCRTKTRAHVVTRWILSHRLPTPSRSSSRRMTPHSPCPSSCSTTQTTLTSLHWN